MYSKKEVGHKSEAHSSMADEKLVNSPEHHMGGRLSLHDTSAYKEILQTRLNNLSPDEIGHRLWTTYRILDEEVCKTEFKDTIGLPCYPGTTASTTVYDGRGNLITATIADTSSFAAVYDKKDNIVGVVRLNSDTHTPSNERDRILQTRAEIFFIGGKPLISGIVPVSRSIGDTNYKKYGVTAESSINITDIGSLAAHFDFKKGDIGKIQIITTCNEFTDGAGINNQTKEDHQQFLLGLLQKAPRTSCSESELAQYLAENGSTKSVSVLVKTLQSPFDQPPFLQGLYHGHFGNGASHYVAEHFESFFTGQCILPTDDYKTQALSVNNNEKVYLRDNSNPRPQPKIIITPASTPAHVASSSSVSAESVPANPTASPLVSSSLVPPGSVSAVPAPEESQEEIVSSNIKILLGKGNYDINQVIKNLIRSKKNKDVTVETLTPFVNELENIKKKTQELKDRGHGDAYNAALMLHGKLCRQLELYINMTHKESSYNNFKTGCNTEVSTARRELEKHRGWKEIILNVLLAITVIGLLGNIKSNHKKGKPTFFVGKTDSQKILDAIAEDIVNMEPKVGA